MTEHPLHALAMEIRRNLTRAQGQLTELMRQIGEYDLPLSSGINCPKCGIERESQLVLDEHLYHQHDGPVPPHWLAIEARSIEPTTDESEAA